MLNLFQHLFIRSRNKFGMTFGGGCRLAQEFGDKWREGFGAFARDMFIKIKVV